MSAYLISAFSYPYPHTFTHTSTPIPIPSPIPLHLLLHLSPIDSHPYPYLPISLQIPIHIHMAFNRVELGVPHVCQIEEMKSLQIAWKGRSKTVPMTPQSYFTLGNLDVGGVRGNLENPLANVLISMFSFIFFLDVQ